MLLVILICSVFVVSLGLTLIFNLDEYYILPAIINVVFGIATFLILLGIPLLRTDSRDFYLKFKSYESTLEQQRKSDGLENTAITLKILEYNSELVVNQRYASNSWTSVFYVSEIRDLKPLK